MARKEDNLRPCEHKLTSEESRKGGIASGIAKRARKDLRRCLELLLEKDMQTKTGETISGAEAISAKLFEQALKGNIKAFETVRSTVGQDPVQKIMVSEVDQSVIDEVEAIVRGEEPGKAEPEKKATQKKTKKTASKTKTSKGEVLKIDPDSGEVVATYPTAAEAARENGIDRSNLAKAIKNGKKAAGYKWEKKG